MNSAPETTALHLRGKVGHCAAFPPFKTSWYSNSPTPGEGSEYVSAVSGRVLIGMPSRRMRHPVPATFEPSFHRSVTAPVPWSTQQLRSVGQATTGMHSPSQENSTVPPFRLLSA